MPSGGVLTIESKNLDSDKTRLAASGSSIAIIVRDTGVGMPPEVIDRAFEPFYTTKDVGHGSGLGLSRVYGFVTQSGGEVQLSSIPGGGTEVTIYLPQVTGRTLKSDAPSRRIHQASEQKTILVVEDDPDVRAVAADFLRDIGYAVTTACDGPEALSILQSDAPIDLLFSDIVMPKGVRGDQLALAARALRPGLHVLLTSGYSQDAAAPEGLGFRLLPKPYRRVDLAAAVSATLDSPHQPNSA
jgi:CheY-like chemotaxis protein